MKIKKIHVFNVDVISLRSQRRPQLSCKHWSGHLVQRKKQMEDSIIIHPTGLALWNCLACSQTLFFLITYYIVSCIKVCLYPLYWWGEGNKNISWKESFREFCLCFICFWCLCTHFAYAPAGARSVESVVPAGRRFCRSCDLWPSSHWLVYLCGSPSCKCTHNLKYTCEQATIYVSHMCRPQHMTWIDCINQLVLCV